MKQSKQTNWFKDAIIYQIYPLSFKDGNNDGIGDIKGIISKLDYLKDLGINCVWLSPVYESPMDDNGYDISNYKKINPMFGTMEDFDTMLVEMHKRGIRLIMDLVANHTSDEHEWFKEARKSKDNKYHDYYIWRKKPNNWTSFFAGSAWEYNEATDEYYLHLFSKKQPDVNWENPKVRQEFKDIMNFWLAKGVDGFRCDVINLISKDQRFKNGAPSFLVGQKYFINGPRLHEFLQDINKDVLSNYNCMTVGETVFTDIDDVKLLTDESRHELSMVFNFDHTNVDNYLGVVWLMRKFKLRRFKKILDRYQYGLKDVGWNSLFYENHDQRRSVGRFNTSDTKFREESAKLLATTMYFLKGTPYIYEGQEIGMTNMEVNSIDDFVDVEAKGVIKTMKKLPLTKKYIDKSIRNGCRDNARVPISWDDSKYAGFSEVEPWLKVNENKSYINVKASLEDKDSILNFYKKLIKVYKEHSEIIRDGIYKDLNKHSNKIYCYERRLNDEILLVVSNFTSKSVKYDALKGYEAYKKEVLLNNYKEDTSLLKPYQSILYLLKK